MLATFLGGKRVFDAAGNKQAEWRAHAGSIWRLSWAHPEFGPVLASCSFDRKVCVWEEASDAEDPAPHPRPAGGWRLAAELQQARDQAWASEQERKRLAAQLEALRGVMARVASEKAAAAARAEQLE